MGRQADSGMRCPTCGSGAKTLETRTEAQGFVIRRRRKCTDDERHVFWTYEINALVWGSIGKEVLNSARGSLKRVAMFQRDKLIVRQVLAGQPVKSVAADYGIASNTVSHILRKAGIKPRRYRGKDKT